MKEYVLVKEMSTKCHLKLITIKFAKMLDLKKIERYIFLFNTRV